jgi:hypothetical protein
MILAFGVVFLYFFLLSVQLTSVQTATLAHNGTGISLADLGVFVVAIALTICFWRYFAREKRLLRDETATLGVVTKTESSRRGQKRIRYSFTDPSGTIRSKVTLDLTGTFREGMAVPVLYNPSNPAEFLSLAGAFHRIIIE